MMNEQEVYALINEGQDPKILVRIYEKIVKVKAPNEKITYIAIQKKPALNLFPDSIILSAQRIYLCEFTNLGRTLKPDVFDWDKIIDLQLEENGAYATLKIVPDTDIDYIVEYIPIDQAKAVLKLSEQYRSWQDQQPEEDFILPPVIQPIDESSEEKIDTPVIQTPVLETDEPFEEPSLEWDWDLTDDERETDDRILKLRKLYERQRITKSEFDMKVREYLNR